MHNNTLTQTTTNDTIRCNCSSCVQLQTLPNSKTGFHPGATFPVGVARFVVCSQHCSNTRFLFLLSTKMQRSLCVALLLVLALSACEASSYPHRHIPDGNTTVCFVNFFFCSLISFRHPYSNSILSLRLSAFQDLNMAKLSYGGLFIVALGSDGQIWRIYQRRDENLTWSEWAPLTKLCPWANDTSRVCEFDADPTIARNPDGRLELFVRFHNNLDLWQMYMQDPMDPESWSDIRESSCVDQDQHTGEWACLCPPVDKFKRCNFPSPNYWVGSPVFPTSDIQVLNDPIDGRIQLYFRGFDVR
jgi:hypothetical protein